MAWQKLSSKKVYENRYMKVCEDIVLTDFGDKLDYGVIRKDPFVVVIPWDGTRVLLVGQYRYPVDYFSWEFPMGHAEKLGIKEAVLAELSQETGLVAQEIEEIGTFYPGSSHLDQIGHIFVTTKFTTGEQDLEPAEKGMQQQWVTLTELRSMITTGVIKDGPTISAFLFFELYLHEKNS